MTWSQYKNPFPFPVPFFARLEFAGILETLDQCSHGGPFSIQTRTTTEAIRVETSTSNYGLDCVWFTYICFSMEKDIVFVCTLFAMDIFLQYDPKYENENAWVKTTMFSYDTGSRHIVQHIVAIS